MQNLRPETVTVRADILMKLPPDGQCLGVCEDGDRCCLIWLWIERNPPMIRTTKPCAKLRDRFVTNDQLDPNYIKH